MEDICNKNSKFSTLCYAEPHIKTIDLSIYFIIKEHHFNLKEEDSLYLIKLKKIKMDKIFLKWFSFLMEKPNLCQV